jgi:hypothetical protein
MSAAWPGWSVTLPPSGETHRAFSFKNNKGLVGIVAMHRVFLPRLVIVHPGVKTWCVKDVLAPFFRVPHIHQVDHFDAREKLLLAIKLQSLQFGTGYHRVDPP